MEKYSKSYWVCLWLSLLALIIVVTVMFSSCKILHTKKESKNDTTRVIKSDLTIKDTSSTGSTKTDNTQSTDKYEWWRIIASLPKGDTNVYNINTYPAPATVIYEGGSGVKEEQREIRDSSWDNKMTMLVAQAIDSMNRKISNLEERSKTETKGVGLLTLILIGAGFLIANKLLGFLGSNYTIKKTVKP